MSAGSHSMETLTRIGNVLGITTSVFFEPEDPVAFLLEQQNELALLFFHLEKQCDRDRLLTLARDLAATTHKTRVGAP